MVEPRVSVVVPFRDRPVERLTALYLSIRAHTETPFEFVVSDYGSSEGFWLDLARASQANGWTVVRSEAQGLPWSRARSINTGVRVSRSDWVSIIDADMVFHDPILDHLLGRASQRQVWFVESRWPQGPRQDPLKGLHHKSYGVFQLLHREWFTQLHGFCEDFELWGNEDTDWVVRLKRAGADVRWLPTTEFRLTHTWHPWENNSADRPLTAVVVAMEIEIRNGLGTYSNPQWGTPWTVSDRPILKAMARQVVPHVVQESELIELSYLPTLKTYLEEGKLIKFQLGPRIPKRRLAKWAGVLLRFQRVFSTFSLRLDFQVATRLEGVLLLRSILGRENIDMFLEPARDVVYLLSR